MGQKRREPLAGAAEELIAVLPHLLGQDHRCPWRSDAATALVLIGDGPAPRSRR